MDKVLQSYLVSLGFSCDAPGLSRFNAALRDAESMAKRATLGIAKGFMEVGAAVTTAYASVGTATIAMMDKVAQSEMGYELLGVKMYMSADAAKKMSIATHALGHDLNEIAWNPKLGRWYGELLRDQGAMQAGLGPDYKKRISEMQEIGQQFTRLKVEGQYFMMGISSAVMKAFGGGDILVKLKGLNDWIIASLPRWSEMVAKYLVPVLKDGLAIGKDLLGIGEILASIFEQFIGELYDDNALKSGKVTFENFGTAVRDVSHSLKEIFDWLKQIADWFHDHAGLTKFVLGGTATGIFGAGVGSAFGPVGTVIGGTGGFLAGGTIAAWSELTNSTKVSGAKTATNGITVDQAKAMAYEAATRHGLDPAVFMGMIEKESSWNPLAKNPHSTASGLGQLLRGTAADMHVGNVFDPYQNLEGSASYLAKLLNQSGNYASALAAYGEGPSYAADILNNRRGHYSDYQPSSITIHSTTGDVNVYVTQPGASADEIAHKTAAAVRKQSSMVVQRNIVGLAGTYA